MLLYITVLCVENYTSKKKCQMRPYVVQYVNNFWNPVRLKCRHVISGTVRAEVLHRQMVTWMACWENFAWRIVSLHFPAVQNLQMIFSKAAVQVKIHLCTGFEEAVELLESSCSLSHIQALLCFQ